MTKIDYLSLIWKNFKFLRKEGKDLKEQVTFYNNGIGNQLRFTWNARDRTYAGVVSVYRATYTRVCACERERQKPYGKGNFNQTVVWIDCREIGKEYQVSD